MHIVIEILNKDIPKHQEIIDIGLHFIDGHIVDADGYGFVELPKGHGRIMDVDKVIKKMEEREKKLQDDRSIWETASVETALDMFGETIIEADAESNVLEQTCHTCKHYVPGEHDGSCGSYICKNYSDWESEE